MGERELELVLVPLAQLEEDDGEGHEGHAGECIRRHLARPVRQVAVGGG